MQSISCGTFGSFRRVWALSLGLHELWRRVLVRARDWGPLAWRALSSTSPGGSPLLGWLCQSPRWGAATVNQRGQHRRAPGRGPYFLRRRRRTAAGHFPQRPAFRGAGGRRWRCHWRVCGCSGSLPRRARGRLATPPRGLTHRRVHAIGEFRGPTRSPAYYPLVLGHRHSASEVHLRALPSALRRPCRPLAPACSGTFPRGSG